MESRTRPEGAGAGPTGRVSPGVRTATRLIRPPRSLYPRRQGRRPGSLFPQKAPWDQGKEREESELFYLPTVSQQFSDGVTGAIAPPHLPDAPRSNNDTHTPYPTCGVAARKRIGSPSLERIIPECFLRLGIIPDQVWSNATQQIGLSPLSNGTLFLGGHETSCKRPWSQGLWCSRIDTKRPCRRSWFQGQFVPRTQCSWMDPKYARWSDIAEDPR